MTWPAFLNSILHPRVKNRIEQILGVNARIRITEQTIKYFRFFFFFFVPSKIYRFCFSVMNNKFMRDSKSCHSKQIGKRVNWWLIDWTEPSANEVQWWVWSYGENRFFIFCSVNENFSLRIVQYSVIYSLLENSNFTKWSFIKKWKDLSVQKWPLTVQE